MASIEKRTGKRDTSYRITVTVGRDASGKMLRHYKTFTPPETWGEAKAEREAQRQATIFEEEIKKGFALDNRQTSEEYAGYVLELKRRQGVKESTLERYNAMLAQIFPEIGYLKLSDIRPAHLNNLYTKLSKSGGRQDKGTATARTDIKADIKAQNLPRTGAAQRAGISSCTLRKAFTETVSRETAEKIAQALNKKPEALFAFERDKSPLADKTVLEFHRLVSTILATAEKEMLVPYNAAAKASPPRPKRKPPNYYQPETVYAILDAADTEPLKYRTFVYLVAVTGARRGEIAGLKWEKIDLKSGTIIIDRGLYYSAKRGVYEGTTKTSDHRAMKIPQETILLLKQLRREQLETRLKNGDRWQEQGYIFTQDDGKPTNPQTWTRWMSDFSQRHGLPHVNPHAFRHTAASVLIASGTDIVTVSKMLGHASAATTENYYSHLIEEAKAAASDALTDVLLRRRA